MQHDQHNAPCTSSVTMLEEKLPLLTDIIIHWIVVEFCSTVTFPNCNSPTVATMFVSTDGWVNILNGTPFISQTKSLTVTALERHEYVVVGWPEN